MKVELKKLKVHNDMSEETTCFSAEVYIDGKHVGHAKNDGRGGCTFIHPEQGMRPTLEAAEAWAKTLPNLPSEYSPDGLPMHFDFYIDMLVDVSQTCKKNKRRGFVGWDEAKAKVHDASGIQYPEFHLWHLQGTQVYHPQPAF